MNSDETKLLSEISGVIQGVAARQEVHASNFTKRLDRIEVSLDGNGKPGIKTRLDRLEQTEKGRCRLAWIAITAAGGAVIAWVSNHWAH